MEVYVLRKSNFVRVKQQSMQKITLLVIAFLLMVAGFSCKEKGFAKPEQLISEKDMVNILYDVHLAKAMSEKYSLSDGDYKYTEDEYYQAVLNKYSLQESVLEQSIIYYTARPKVYEKIYQRVIEKISFQDEESKKNSNMSVAGEEK